MAVRAVGSLQKLIQVHRQTPWGSTRLLSTASDTPIYDLVCIGGGPAGLSLLTALRASPLTSSLKLALIESRDLTGPSTWSPPKSHFSNRASSLTPSSKSFLSSIGAWSLLDGSRIQPYDAMQVWDGVSGSRIDFSWALTPQTKKQDPTIAYMTENDNLVRALITQLSELGGADIYHGETVEHISLGPSPSPQSPQQSEQDKTTLNLSSYPHLTLSDGSRLAARLLVGADGPNSPVRTFAGIGSGGWDYNRHGLVATLKLSCAPDESIAYQRFLPAGPIALLPLPGPYATLVWSTTPANAAHLKSLSEPDFLAMVNAAFRLSTVDVKYMHTIPSGQEEELEWRMKHTPQVGIEEGYQIPHLVTRLQEGSRASFPLRMRHADTYATHRVALVGDAAHTIHPLAGQGLNMGLGDVECLAKIMGEAVDHGQDVGDQITLEKYNAERYGVNHTLLGVVDKLHKLYSWETGPVVWGRSLGLEAVNAVPALKGFLMGQATGGAGSGLGSILGEK